MVNRRILYTSGLIFVLLMTAIACSTEKDAAINRWYHQTTTKYNGYFNANELIKEALNGYYDIRKEDYTSLLPIEPLPSEEEAIALYPALDTAVSKCTKLIAKHSMPSIETGKKTEEFNKWMDDVWITIGKSKYIKREYEDAFKNFKYITKFFKKGPAKFWGNLWIVRTHLQVGETRQAEMLLKIIDRDMEEIQTQEKEKKEVSKKSKSKIIRKKNKKNSSKESTKPVKLDKTFEYELLKTKASLAIINEKYEEAQKFLSDALDKAHFKNRKEKARLYFILAQLSVQNGDLKKGIDSYTQVIKSDAKYDMAFAAKLNRAMANGANGNLKIRKELNKMLRDEKNFEFKDQIYYALGDVEMSAGNKDIAINDFTKSTFYSINNERQKGMSYERMGDVFFADKNYLKAQKYYDSCITVVPDNYKHYGLVKNKADKLKDLVVALETVSREDSLQRIAKLSPEEQEKFAAKVKKQIEQEAQRQREAAAVRMAQLQEIQNRSKGNTGGGKWYFYDADQRNKGFDAFKSVWGQRTLEDNWRRSNKIMYASFVEQDTDSVVVVAETPVEDSLTVESLLADIPNSDSAVSASQNRLMDALYASGRIYYSELNETDLAIQQLKDLLSRNIESPNNLLSMYELYKIYIPIDVTKSDYYKNMILNNYPNSDFANYIRDPDYFVKQKEREKIDLENFEKSIERYRSGLYGLVQAKSNMIITTDTNNVFRSKYMLLYVLAKGQNTENKEELIPDLNALIKEYPNTDEAKRAILMINIIKTGYSKDIELNFGKSSSYDYDATAPVFLIIVLNSVDKSNEIKTNLSNFNREFFSQEQIKTQASQLSNNTPIILIREFSNDIKAKKYLTALDKTKKYNIDEIKSLQHFLITSTNYAKLITTSDLKGYLDFYKDFYK